MENEDLMTAGRTLFQRPFDGIIRIELIDDEGVVWVDGRCDPPEVSTQPPIGVDRNFCLWRVEADDIPLVLTRDKGRLESSFVSGRLKISGDMSIMTRLNVEQ